jgi:hypothetical protein
VKRRTGTVFAIIFGAVVMLGTAGAVSRFVGLGSRPKAYECKVVLRDILWAQRGFHDANGRYAASLEELKFKLPEKRRYAYRITATTPGDFTAECEDQGDRWIISSTTGEPQHIGEAR